MQNFRRIKKDLQPLILLVVISTTLFVACQKEEVPEVTNQDMYKKVGNLLVNTDIERTSASRIQFVNNLIPIVPDKTLTELKSTSTFPDIDLTKNYIFKLKAEVASPVFNDNTLQATHVSITNNTAFVSYNTKGPKWLGGIDVFDVSDINNPILISSAILPEADVSSIAHFGNKLYIVGAMGNYETLGYSSPAFLEVLNLNENNGIASVDTILDISSYVGTDVKVTSHNIIATSGSTGHLTLFNHDYSPGNSVELENARSLDVYGDTAFVLQGQLGRINMLELPSVVSLTEYILGGANTPDSKSEIAVNEQYIFAALNEGGLSMLHKNGTLNHHIPKPVPQEGLLPENNVTNSVSLNHELVLIGNGESGVFVGATIKENHDSITMLGSMQFDGYASTNFVESKDSVIFVATGKEGLKIISIGIDDGVPDGINPTEPCESLIGDISGLFPESKDARILLPDLFADIEQLNIRIKKETELYITFIDEGAGWKNSVGYYTYPEGNPPTSPDDIEYHLLFPNVSKTGEGGGLHHGDQIQLGTEAFPAGTVVGFYLVAKGWQNGAVGEGLYTHYTNPGLNINAEQQNTLFVSDGCNDLVLTFEDIKLSASNCDYDFNDIILLIKDNPQTDMPNTRIDLSGIPVK